MLAQDWYRKLDSPATALEASGKTAQHARTTYPQLVQWRNSAGTCQRPSTYILSTILISTDEEH